MCLIMSDIIKNIYNDLNDIFRNRFRISGLKYNNKAARIVADHILYNQLLETYGIRDYSNSGLHNRLQEISDELFSFIQRVDSTQHRFNCVLVSNEYSYRCQCFEYDLSGYCDWLGTLRILMCIDVIPDNEIRMMRLQMDPDKFDELIGSISNETCVVADSVIYRNYGSGNRIENCLFKLYDNTCNEKILFEKETGCAVISTILFNIKNRYEYKKDEMVFILHHVNDLLFGDMGLINRDVVDMQVLSLEDEEMNRIMEMLIDCSGYSEMKQILKEMNCDVKEFMESFFVNNLYYLNESEMRAHINQFDCDLKNVNPMKFHHMVRKRFYEVKKVNAVEMISDIYRRYLRYVRLLRLFKEIARKRDK